MNKGGEHIRGGFSAIELVISVAVLTFGILGMYTAFQSMISLSYEYSLRLTAAYLAQEGVEIIENIRDTNYVASLTPWNVGLTSCTQGCQVDYKTGTGWADPTTDGSAPLPYDDTHFLALNTDGFYDYNGITSPSVFRRRVTITQGADVDGMKIDVVVTWSYNGRASSFETERYIYNWH